MRLVNWNIEWMNNWFVGGGQVDWVANRASSGITDTQALAARVAQVITDLQPDVVAVEEGPSDIREMQLFVDDHLGGNYDVLGGLDGGAQKAYVLAHHGGEYQGPVLASDQLTTDLFETWEVDTDGDLVTEDYDFTRDPLVVDGTVHGQSTRIVVLHTKSKYVHRGQAMYNDPARRMEFITTAMINRRRISAEAFRTRRYVDDLLAQDPQARIVICGDFNDGPGHDFFERRYLTHNITDILLGSTFNPATMFRHAFLEHVDPAHRFTAIFDDYVDEIDDRPILLDHIVVSPALAATLQLGGIAHNEFEGQIDNGAGGRQETPSDHRPVWMETA